MTPPPHPPQLEFYPSYCFAVASPTYNVWAKLTATDVHALSERKEFVAQNIYFYLNHPIRWICVTGVVVAVDEFEKRTILWVDDGSGSWGGIEVVWERPCPSSSPSNANATTAVTTLAPPRTTATPDISGIDIGTVIRAKGTITTFRNTRQILLKRVEILPDTQSEVKAWKGVTRFRVEVLGKPWELEPEEVARMWEAACGVAQSKDDDEENAKKKNEGTDRRSRRKKREREPFGGGGSDAEARRREKKERKRKRKLELAGREDQGAGRAETRAVERVSAVEGEGIRRETGEGRVGRHRRPSHKRRGTLDALGL
ncbi:hypothetical protein FGG08_001301 [Glutinoglossum americanum]|uniref:CST complex subunit Stn1 N-terminal domain-containing protein n=1 Tax=Glutinoglossum americanum TaxID=1670608 RepID=A0A9P8L5E8_9PEZI|nr:hypothetical protein FGG08_001301 [Glutinoglossum americanum]